MMFPEWLLDELQCPHTGESLTFATDEMLKQLREAAAKGSLRSKIGRNVAELPERGLVNASRSWFYPVADNGTVELLPDDALGCSFAGDSQ
jgi:hypothetical protein